MLDRLRKRLSLPWADVLAVQRPVKKDAALKRLCDESIGHSQGKHSSSYHHIIPTRPL